MLSDVLNDTIKMIDRYLRDYQDIYAGTIRESVLEVRSVIHNLADELDIAEGDMNDRCIEEKQPR